MVRKEKKLNGRPVSKKILKVHSCKLKKALIKDGSCVSKVY